MFARSLVAAAFAVTLAGARPGAGIDAQTPGKTHRTLPPKPSEAQMAADRALLDHLGRELSVNSIGVSHKDSLYQLHLENWKRSLATDTLAAVARRGLELVLREDSTARKAKVLSARFSDYKPEVVTLTWTIVDFAARPERFQITRKK